MIILSINNNNIQKKSKLKYLSFIQQFTSIKNENFNSISKNISKRTKKKIRR